MKSGLKEHSKMSAPDLVYKHFDIIVMRGTYIDMLKSGST